MFNVHIQSTLLSHTPITGTGAGLHRFLCLGQGKLYQFCVMPFGLAAAFQQLMNSVLINMPNVSVNLEDVVLANDSWPEHIRELKQISPRLERANLTINL